MEQNRTNDGAEQANKSNDDEKKKKRGEHGRENSKKKLRHLFLNAVASLPLRLWFGSTCAFGAMHGGMERDGAMWVMCEGLGALIGQISQIFGCVG